MIMKIKHRTKKMYYERSVVKYYNNKTKDIYIQYKDLVRTYVELDNRLKAMEEN